jgi:hypothetical protein
MRNTDEEAQHWEYWARMPSLAILCILLLGSVAFAAKDIDSSPSSIKNGKLYERLSLVDGSGFSDEKLDAKSYRIYSDKDKTEAVMDFEVKNEISIKNFIQDCPLPYTCDFKVQITPKGKNIKLDNSILSGGWKDGQASVQKVFFYQNESYTYQSPVYSQREVSEYTAENGTLVRGHSEVYISSYETQTAYRMIEQTDLSQLYADNEQPVDVVIRFARTEIAQVDIYPKLFGKDYTDWSYWGTGGTETTYINGSGANITVHTFTTNGTFSVNHSLTATILIVAGGGGGGGNNNAGGGGAGGLVYNSSAALAAGDYSIVVGLGGLGKSSGAGQSGWNSEAFGTVALGGGGGGSGDSGPNGANGGSGGGGGYNSASGGTATQQGSTNGGLGNNGATGQGLVVDYAGGGGGGSGTAAIQPVLGRGGYGGNGTAYSINGTSVYYAGGGGGSVNPTSTKGLGGLGGGGNGTVSQTGGIVATNGVDGLGGGGGGGGGDVGPPNQKTGGNGGSGIVIISYPTAVPFIDTMTASLISPANGTIYPLNTTSIPLVFNCSGSQTSYLANITINGVVNATAINATSNASTSYGLTLSTFESGGYNWSVSCYNTTTRADTANSTFIIRNFAPNITNLSISPNGSVYQLGPLFFNITISHADDHPMNASYSWFKNGINQTALAGLIAIINNTNTQINNLAVPFTVGDNWSVSVFATDGFDASSTNTTANTTIQNCISNLTTNYTDPQYDIYSYTQRLNLTMAGANNVSATLNYGGANHSTSKIVAGSVYYFSAIVSPSQVSDPLEVNYTWFYTASLANGSSIVQNTSYLINTTPSGLLSCNATYTTVSLNYSVLDFSTGAAINATYTSTYTGVVNRSATGKNTTYQWCINPNNASLTVTIYETYSATGYAPVLTQRTINATNTTQQINIYMVNTTHAYPTTLSLQQLPNIPLAGQTITISQYTPPSNYTLIQSCVTGTAGTCLVYLVPNSIYYFYNLTEVATTVGPEVLVCSPDSASCFRNFFIGSGATIPPVSSGAVSGTCSYSTITKTVTCNGQSTASTILGFGLLTYQSGANSTNCSNTSLGATATLSCSIPQVNNTQWIYTLYSIETGTNESITSGTVSINLDRSASLGRDSWFIMLFLFLFLAAVGAAHPLLGMAFGVLGLLLGVFVGIVPFNAVSGSVIVIAVMAGAVIYKLRV